MTKRIAPALTGRIYAEVPVTTINEEWRDVVGFEGLYIVSDKGRLYGMYSHNFLRPNKTRKGYLRTTFRTHDKRSRYVGVHALVAAAFIGPCPEGMEVNHKNGIKADNRAENLEYGTHSHNIKHSYDTGLRGPIVNGSRLSVDKVMEMRRLWNAADRTISKRGKAIIRKGELAKIAKRFGVAAAYVHAVATGKSWSWL